MSLTGGWRSKVNSDEKEGELTTSSALHERFTAVPQMSPARAAGRLSSGRDWPSSSAPAGSSKCNRSIDGQPFRSSFMARGDGTHKLSLEADLRRAIGKEAGDTVTVQLDERLDG